MNTRKTQQKNNLKAKIVAQVHDELIIDCPKDELEIVKQLLKSTMENTTKLDVNLDVDVEYGDKKYELTYEIGS